MGQLLDDFFLSHEIGMLKPDLAAFEHVIQRLDVKPNRIAFFDDLEVNVRSARQVGMKAFVTRGLPEVRERLVGLGVLSLGGLQLAGADAASAWVHARCSCAAPLSSQPLCGLREQDMLGVAFE